MTKKAPNSGGQSGAATEPTEAEDIAKSEASTKKGLIEMAAYNDAKRLTENAWKTELQSALKNEVYDDELRGKIEVSILKLPQKPDIPEHLRPALSGIIDTRDAGSREHLENDVVAILTAAAFERFAATKSETPASKRTTKYEIERLLSLTTRTAKHIKNLHQTSRELLENALPNIDGLQILLNSAAIAAHACKGVINELADVSFCEQSTGRKVNTVAESVTRTAAVIFRKRTGKLPGRTTDRISGETGGPFIEWLTELFSIMKIDASADAEARKYLERARMETTAKNKSVLTM